SYASVNKENPIFDVENTPCCVGALPENFRKSKDVYRSLCATHSVAIWGKNAQSIANAHLNSTTPAGENSPYRYLKENDGKIIMLGCGLFCNTSMHAVEELVNPDYLFKDETNYKIISKDKTEKSQTLKNHYFKNTSQRYDRIINVLPSQYIKQGKVLDAQCFVIDAPQMWKYAQQQMLKNNHFFVDMG
ncbi:MAG: AAC(3) family N-acetyltransferase, partial [Oscillospiraceae bacterium]